MNGLLLHIHCASNYMYCFMLHIHVYVFLLPPPLFSQVERLQRINDENAEKLESSELQINAVSNEYRNIIQQREVRVVTCRVGMGWGGGGGSCVSCGVRIVSL